LQLRDHRLNFSATDLSQHLACKHLTQLNRQVAEGRRPPPPQEDAALALLQQRGLAHEAAYLSHLEAEGRSIRRFPENAQDVTVEHTLEAMKSGVDGIVQAVVQHECWRGRTDFLIRVNKPSGLGAWSYEVVDTKLALTTKAGTILQLCLYSDIMAQLQDFAPEFMHVVKPGQNFVPETFRFDDYRAYFRLVRSQLDRDANSDPPTATYPSPVAHCEICRWWRDCDTRRHQDDHLSLVAAIRTFQIQELDRQGVSTLTAFGDRDTPLPQPPERGHLDSFTTAHGQAKIQLRGRRQEQLIYEFLPVVAARGLQRLPSPSAGDMFFDLEADPFVDDGGLEYLFGYAYRNDRGELQYTANWAMSRVEEKRAFEQFIDFVMARCRDHPDMHVYHFAPYEPAALKRLMGRHAVREPEMDQLLRAGRFVDLHAAFRQGLRASVERYSLKDIEAFFGFRRRAELRLASQAMLRVSSALELGVADEITPDDRAMVQEYNRDDCLATVGLQEWLEQRRSELEQRGEALARPIAGLGEANEAIQQREAQVQAVFDQLLNGLPDDRATWTAAEQGRWLLAHLLDYFRREDRCAWWEYFRLLELEPEELMDERKAVVGLRFERDAGGTARCPIHRYQFPSQEVGLSEGDTLHAQDGQPIGTVSTIDPMAGVIEIKKRGDAANMHPSAVIVNDRVNPVPLDGSLLSLAEALSGDALAELGEFQAARDLLCKRPPRLTQPHTGPLRQEGEDAVAAALRLSRNLTGGVLPIQGPPGSGKTHTGARMIAQLVADGQRVGVTAVSHKVIRKLLEGVLAAADELGFDIRAAHKVTESIDDTNDRLEEVKSNDGALAALQDRRLLGGTAWLWARDDAVGTVDYLFVDEAGQLSLAHVLAASRATTNLVLLGDPQQLEQPQRGAHPEGAEIAALNHVLDRRPTVQPDRGLFLEQTWRLHPNICQFTSELYYENRLQARAENARQSLLGSATFATPGLYVVPIEHAGNQNTSREEVVAVARLISHLVGSGIRWRNADGVERPLQEEDILVVVPYNAHAAAMLREWPNARVGTVDRFQGQEAPVVIYSLASSSAEDAPRGMTFLYDPHRMNVATSRARCACILVASPQLFEPDCKSPQQMLLANGLCRYREMATTVPLDTIPAP